MKNRIVIAAGGTGGHIYPAFSIAERVKNALPELEIIFIGTKKGMEAGLVKEKGYEFRTIFASGLIGKNIFNMSKALFSFFAGVMQSLFILSSLKPDLVIGTGAYVSAPVIFSAFMLKIPSVIHEQNVIPGFTNKYLSRFADKVMVSFAESGNYFKKAAVAFTGYPLRSSLEKIGRNTALAKLGIEKNGNNVLVIGGSRGAEGINKIMREMFLTYGEELKKYGFIWITGKNNYEKYKNVPENVKIIPYLSEMEFAYSCADLAVSRSGAGAVAELSYFGIPSILIPFPKAVLDHQSENAKIMEKNKAGIILRESDVNPLLLKETVVNLLNDVKKLDEMKKASMKIGEKHALCTVEKEITDILKEKGENA